VPAFGRLAVGRECELFTLSEHQTVTVFGVKADEAMSGCVALGGRRVDEVGGRIMIKVGATVAHIMQDAQVVLGGRVLFFREGLENFVGKRPSRSSRPRRYRLPGPSSQISWVRSGQPFRPRDAAFLRCRIHPGRRLPAQRTLRCATAHDDRENNQIIQTAWGNSSTERQAPKVSTSDTARLTLVADSGAVHSRSDVKNSSSICFP